MSIGTCLDGLPWPWLLLRAPIVRGPTLSCRVRHLKAGQSPAETSNAKSMARAGGRSAVIQKSRTGISLRLERLWA